MLANVLIYVALLPLTVAACVAILCRQLRVRARVAWAAGVGIGYFAGQLGLASQGNPTRAFSSLFRPHEAVDWLPHAVLLAIGIAMLANYAPRAWHRLPVALAAALSIGLPLRLLAESAYVTQRWSTLEKLLYLALLSATLGLTWLVVGAARDDEHPRLRPLLLILLAVGAAVVIALSGAFVYGELCGVLAAAMTGTALFSSRGANGAAGVVTVALGGLIVLSCFYAKLAPANAALLFLSAIFAGGRLPGFLPTWLPWQLAALRVGLCLVPLSIALARSFAAAQADVPSGPYTL